MSVNVNMEEKDLVTLTEAVERSKSNTHQIGDLKDEIKEIRNEQKTIYDLTSSVKLIAQDMSSIKESVNKVEQGQNMLSEKVDMQISDVKNQIESVDSKSKFDALPFMIKTIIPTLIGLGIGAYIMQLVK